MNHTFKYGNVKDVYTKEEALSLILSKFGTVMCERDIYFLEVGEFWIVHPPEGIRDFNLNILIKKQTP